MSQWRREASRQLPELQSKIASPSVHSPSDLWMELKFEFDRLCHEEPAPIELLSRIWAYARWSSDHKDEQVQWAVISFFYENMEDTRAHRKVVPLFVSLEEYEQACGLREPGNTQE